MMQYYATIYASSMGVMLLFKFIRGIAFVKVRTPHRVLMTSGTEGLRVHNIPLNLVKCSPEEVCFSRYTITSLVFSLMKERCHSLLRFFSPDPGLSHLICLHVLWGNIRPH